MSTEIEDFIEKLLQTYPAGRNIKTAVGGDLSTLIGLVKSNQFILGMLSKEIKNLHAELEFINQKNESLDKQIKEAKILIRKIPTSKDEGTSQARPTFSWHTPEQTDYKKVFRFRKTE